MSQKPSETSKLEERMGEFKPFSDSPSCSRSITETVDGSHKFTIKGYSLTKGIGAGKYIMSDTFSVGGYDWVIYFYPEGKNPEDNCLYVSVFIALASEGTNVRALFKLTLEDQNEKGNDKVHYYFDRPLESGPYTLKYRGCMWGYKRFFRRTMLETSEYLKDDCLVMHCSVGVVKTRFEGTKQSIIVPQSDMAQNFNDFFESEVGCDILFKVGNESFKAHKLILAARSPVFRAQFFGLVGDPSMKEEVIDDIEPFIFKVMLLYIYTDELPDMYDDKDSMPLWSHTAMVQHLLAAADRYYLDRLKLLCESKLCEEINTGTVSTTLALAEQHHCPQLKAICLKFIANPSNLGVVMQSESFMHLKESCPSVLLELLETFASVDENSIWTLSKKRNGGSIYGQDLEDGRAAESVNPNGRRIRRRT